MKKLFQSMVFDTQLQKALQSWSDSTWKVISGEEFSIEFSGMASPYLSHCYMEYRPGTGHNGFVMLENERFFGVIHEHPVEPNVDGNFLSGIVPVRCVAHLIPWQFPRFFERGERFCHVTLFDQFGGFDEEGTPIEREQGFLFLDKALIYARGIFNTSSFFYDSFTWNLVNPKKIYRDDDSDDADGNPVTFLPCSVRGADFGIHLDRKFTMKPCFETFGDHLYHRYANGSDTQFNIESFRREWFRFIKECIPPQLNLVHCEDDTFMVTKSAPAREREFHFPPKKMPFPPNPLPAQERVLINGDPGPEVDI